MNDKDFKQLLNDTHLKMCLLSSTKGVEYAGKSDRLDNFKRLGNELGLDPTHVLWVYFTKHLDAIRHYLRATRALSEPIEERIDDAILYLILLKGLIQEREGVQGGDAVPPYVSSGSYSEPRGLNLAGDPGSVVLGFGTRRLDRGEVDPPPDSLGQHPVPDR